MPGKTAKAIVTGRIRKTSGTIGPHISVSGCGRVPRAGSGESRAGLSIAEHPGVDLPADPHLGGDAAGHVGHLDP